MVQVSVMTDSYICYKVIMALCRQMRGKGIISGKEYALLEKHFAEKYGLKENDVFRDTDLLCSGYYGNITDDKN